MDYKWTIADHISDRIIAILNSELEQMKRQGDIQLLQLLAGQLLAFKALQNTMPIKRPLMLDRLSRCVDDVLRELLESTL